MDIARIKLCEMKPWNAVTMKRHIKGFASECFITQRTLFVKFWYAKSERNIKQYLSI